MLEPDWRRRGLRSIGAPITRENLQFLQSWQRQEGGGTANSANFNPLNTTSGRGSSINSVGVKSFGSAQQGIAATRATLLNGRYGDIVAALRHGDPLHENVSAGLETWVSGNPTGNASYAARVLGGRPTGVTAGGGGRGPSAAVTRGPNMAKVEAARNTLISQLLANSQALASGNPDALAQSQSLLALVRDKNAYANAYQTLGPIVSPHGTLHSPGATGNASIDHLLSAAHSQIGKPYAFGTEKQNVSFDCSGLVQWAYSQLGVRIPRTTYQQFKVGQPVKWGQFQPGDLIFAAGSDGTRSNPGHVVMYVGGGRVIAAPHTGTVVQYQPVSQFKNDFAGARRII